MIELFIKFIAEKYPFKKATTIFNVELMDMKIFLPACLPGMQLPRKFGISK
jgi:hypothetical protein